MPRLMSPDDADLQNQVSQAGLLVAEIQKIALNATMADQESALSTIEAIATAASKQLAEIEMRLIMSHAAQSEQDQGRAGLALGVVPASLVQA